MHHQKKTPQLPKILEELTFNFGCFWLQNHGYCGSKHQYNKGGYCLHSGVYREKTCINLGVTNCMKDTLAGISNKWPIVSSGYPFSSQETVEVATSGGVVINSLTVLNRRSVVATQRSKSPWFSILSVFSFKFFRASELWTVEKIVITETTLRDCWVNPCTSS